MRRILLTLLAVMGVAIGAFATSIITADLSKVVAEGSNATWNAATHTFSWTADNDARITLPGLSGDLSKATTLTIETSNFKEGTGEWTAWRVDFMVGETVIKGTDGAKFYSGGTKTVELSKYLSASQLSNITAIRINTDSKSGSVDINAAYITIDDEASGEDADECTLESRPYYRYKSGTGYQNTTPSYTYGKEVETVYGDGNNVQKCNRYADLTGYAQMRVYQTTGNPVRCWFYTDAEGTAEATQHNAEVVDGENYYVVDLTGHVLSDNTIRLVAIKGNRKATVTKIVLVKDPSYVDPTPGPAPDDTSENLITGDAFNFEGGTLGGWSSWGNSSSKEIVAGGADGSAYCIALTNPSEGSDYYVAQAAYAVSFTNGHEYSLTFQAKSKSAGGSVQVAYQNSSNYEGAGYSTIDLTTEWSTYTQNWTVGKDNMDRILINFGKAANTFYFDNIVLVDKTISTSIECVTGTMISGNEPRYSLTGKRVGDGYKGIVISGGKKYMQR